MTHKERLAIERFLSAAETTNSQLAKEFAKSGHSLGFINELTGHRRETIRWLRILNNPAIRKQVNVA